eukprot:2546339-Amphidinium_carterae.1
MSCVEGLEQRLGKLSLLKFQMKIKGAILSLDTGGRYRLFNEDRTPMAWNPQHVKSCKLILLAPKSDVLAKRTNAECVCRRYTVTRLLVTNVAALFGAYCSMPPTLDN